MTYPIQLFISRFADFCLNYWVHFFCHETCLILDSVWLYVCLTKWQRFVSNKRQVGRCQYIMSQLTICQLSTFPLSLFECTFWAAKFMSRVIGGWLNFELGSIWNEKIVSYFNVFNNLGLVIEGSDSGKWKKKVWTSFNFPWSPSENRLKWELSYYLESVLWRTAPFFYYLLFFFFVFFHEEWQ